MRLLLVVDTFDPRWGGSLEAPKQLGLALRALGNHIEFLSADGPDAPWKPDWDIPTHSLGPARTFYQYSPKITQWMRENRHRFDAVILNNIWRYGTVGCWRALRKTDTPFFVFAHGMLDPWFQRHFIKHIQKTVFWKLFIASVIAEARSVLFTCEEERRLASTSFAPYRCNEHVVGLGLLPPPEHLSEARTAFLDRFPSLHGKRLLLFLGRLHPKKGCDILLTAFAQVCSRNPNLTLAFAGPGDDAYAAQLKALPAQLGCASQIEWLGPVFDAMKWGAMAAAGAFVLTSHSENFGITVAESLACGTPVLMSNRINIWREIAADGAALVCDDTVPSVKTMLDKWMSMAPEAEQLMKQAAITCFQTRFDGQQVAGTFDKYLREECGVGHGGTT